MSGNCSNLEEQTLVVQWKKALNTQSIFEEVARQQLLEKTKRQILGMISAHVTALDRAVRENKKPVESRLELPDVDPAIERDLRIWLEKMDLQLDVLCWPIPGVYRGGDGIRKRFFVKPK